MLPEEIYLLLQVLIKLTMSQVSIFTQPFLSFLQTKVPINHGLDLLMGDNLLLVLAGSQL